METQRLKILLYEAMPELTFRCMQQVFSDCRSASESLMLRISDAIQMLLEVLAQKENEDAEPIQMICFQALRYGIAKQTYEIRITAYGLDWYFDRAPVYVSFTGKEFFAALEPFADEIRRLIWPFVYQRHESIVDECVQNMFLRCLHFITPFARRAVSELIRSPMFKKIKTHDELYFVSGEYQGKSDTIYIHSKYPRYEILEKYIMAEKEEKQEIPAAVYRNYSNCIMKNTSIWNAILSYTNFSNASISSVDFSSSVFASSDFYQAKWQLSYCEATAFFDTMFRNSDLRESLFLRCDGGIQKPEPDRLFSASILGIDFGKADLRGTMFRNCNLSGADFRGAIFDENSDFLESNLNECLFSNNAKNTITLSQEQIKSVTFAND